MARIARIVLPSLPHHVVQRGNNRQAVFLDNADRQFYIALLRKYAHECGCKIKAYCLMENHVHLLLVPQHRESLAAMMQKLSLVFTQYINKKYRRTGRLWECRFYSSIVDRDSYLWTVCRYIEMNPVRADIVKDALDYTWSSAKANASADHRVGFIEPIWKDYLSRDEYAKFLCQQGHEIQDDEIRKSVLRGLPVGSETFMKKIEQGSNISVHAKRRGRPRKETENRMCP